MAMRPAVFNKHKIILTTRDTTFSPDPKIADMWATLGMFLLHLPRTPGEVMNPVLTILCMIVISLILNGDRAFTPVCLFAICRVVMQTAGD